MFNRVKNYSLSLWLFQRPLMSTKDYHVLGGILLYLVFLLALEQWLSLIFFPEDCYKTSKGSFYFFSLPGGSLLSVKIMRLNEPLCSWKMKFHKSSSSMGKQTRRISSKTFSELILTYLSAACVKSYKPDTLWRCCVCRHL